MKPTILTKSKRCTWYNQAFKCQDSCASTRSHQAPLWSLSARSKDRNWTYRHQLSQLQMAQQLTLQNEAMLTASVSTTTSLYTNQRNWINQNQRLTVTPWSFWSQRLTEPSCTQMRPSLSSTASTVERPAALWRTRKVVPKLSRPRGMTNALISTWKTPKSQWSLTKYRWGRRSWTRFLVSSRSALQHPLWKKRNQRSLKSRRKLLTRGLSVW